MEWNASNIMKSFKKCLKKENKRKKILFDVRASEDCYNDLQEIIQTLNSWLS